MQPRLVFETVYTERCLACGDDTSLGVPDFDCLNPSCRWAVGRPAPSGVERIQQQLALLAPVRSFETFRRLRSRLQTRPNGVD